tara:strand:- start:843 stop:1646 length:804 start_codon:yes stop_codon:yes gene_type:complete
MIPVHLMGLPCDMRALVEIANKHDLKIIEDACESMLAKFNGKPVGSFGDIACFSTYVAHFLVTGVGGFAITNNQIYASLLRSLMNHGRDPIYTCIDDDQNLSSEELFKVISGRFKFLWPGHSFRCTELEAAIGLGQLERMESILSARKKHGAFFNEKLSKYCDHLQLPSQFQNEDYAPMLYPIVVISNKFTKTDLVHCLERHSVETRDLFPLIDQPVYKNLYGDITQQYPVSVFTSNNGFYIGCHQDLTQEDLQYLVGVFDDFFSKF